MSTVNDLNIVAENLFMDEDEENGDINDLSVDLEDLILPPDMQENADVLGDLKEEIIEEDESIAELIEELQSNSRNSSHSYSCCFKAHSL